ncbi:hypothetical protein JYU34_015664 [Plutella xylostella]|uniref:Uncharacterized protein n=1 Tax=Plutella xylostella TaxID=51655 RepID=A0ABQ7Q4F9_PLUXY|nr:hypothetical protein JYU34_015664 [Plutella xylostella]
MVPGPRAGPSTRSGRRGPGASPTVPGRHDSARARGGVAADRLTARGGDTRFNREVVVVKLATPAQRPGGPRLRTLPALTSPRSLAGYFRRRGKYPQIDRGLYAIVVCTALGTRPNRNTPS